MWISISDNGDYIRASFYKICYENVKRLLEYLKIEKVSVFVDNEVEYRFNGIISADEFAEKTSRLKRRFIIFDGEVKECSIDKEIEVLSERKIFVDFVLHEKETFILINLHNIKVTKKEVKEILKNPVNS